MAGAAEWLAGWSHSIQASYGVDPRIFIGLVLVSIPPFYAAFAIAIQAALRARRADTPLASDRVFVLASAAFATAWLLPYAYVALVGRLPLWTWAAFIGLLSVGALRLAVSWHRRTAREVEAVDD